MKNLLSQILFKLRSIISRSGSDRKKNEEREAHVAQIIEQVIDGVDPRLRSVGKYAQKLRPSVEKIIDYADITCQKLPGPVELSREAWSKDHLVRAIFATSDDIQRVFSHHDAIRTFFKDNPDPDITHAYAVLGMKKHEQTVMGMKQTGDVIRRGVAYTNVIFDDYRVTHPSLDEESLRANLRQRAMNECIAQALNKIVEMRNYGNELKEQKLMLEMQLRILAKESSGLTEMMQGEDDVRLKIVDVKKRLASIEEKYSDVHEEVGTLDAFLEQTASLLMQPAKLIDVEEIHMYLDKMNRLIESHGEEEGKRINMAQVTFSGKDKRVGVLVKFPRESLLPEENFLKKAKNLLR
ncbi:MAG: hypothetical protein EP297_01695 [Gammaproteobacteria bacterium]|nr:MAG: hypothetical protein EP297_01695 [Gammaproteobacteria bacterium]